MGDLFTSLVHTCELNKVNPFAYLTLVLRHSDEVKKAPADWLPWNRQEPGLRPPQTQES
ncbi:MAG: transposase domain-containing protein [Vulcanimicrobiota bacterium]